MERVVGRCRNYRGPGPSTTCGHLSPGSQALLAIQMGSLPPTIAMVPQSRCLRRSQEFNTVPTICNFVEMFTNLWNKAWTHTIRFWLWVMILVPYPNHSKHIMRSIWSTWYYIYFEPPDPAKKQALLNKQLLWSQKRSFRLISNSNNSNNSIQLPLSMTCFGLCCPCFTRQKRLRFRKAVPFATRMEAAADPKHRWCVPAGFGFSSFIQNSHIMDWFHMLILILYFSYSFILQISADL